LIESPFLTMCRSQPSLSQLTVFATPPIEGAVGDGFIPFRLALDACSYALDCQSPGLWYALAAIVAKFGANPLLKPMVHSCTRVSDSIRDRIINLVLNCAILGPATGHGMSPDSLRVTKQIWGCGKIVQP